MIILSKNYSVLSKILTYYQYYLTQVELSVMKTILPKNPLHWFLSIFHGLVINKMLITLRRDST